MIVSIWPLSNARLGEAFGVGETLVPVVIWIESVSKVVHRSLVNFPASEVLSSHLVEGLWLVVPVSVLGSHLVSMEALGSCVALAVLKQSILVVTRGIGLLGRGVSVELVAEELGRSSLGLKSHPVKGDLTFWDLDPCSWLVLLLGSWIADPSSRVPFLMHCRVRRQSRLLAISSRESGSSLIESLTVRVETARLESVVINSGVFVVAGSRDLSECLAQLRIRVTSWNEASVLRDHPVVSFDVLLLRHVIGACSVAVVRRPAPASVVGR